MGWMRILASWNEVITRAFHKLLQDGDRQAQTLPPVYLRVLRSLQDKNIKTDKDTFGSYHGTQGLISGHEGELRLKIVLVPIVEPRDINLCHSKAQR